QLASRPKMTCLYVSYPFDRLRRRLGLPALDVESVNAADDSCKGPRELDQLDPPRLDGPALAAAAASAQGLGDDRRTARFAAELFRRAPESLAAYQAPKLLGALLRQALNEEGDAEAALDWLDRAEQVDSGRNLRTYQTWRA